MQKNSTNATPRFRKIAICGQVKPGRKHTMLRFALVILSFGLMATYVSAADVDKPNDLHHDNPWLNEHLLSDKAPPPFSFLYDRQGSGVLLKAWPREIETKQLDGRRTEHIVLWTDPKTGVQVRLSALDFTDSPVVEWTAYFKNTGKVDTPDTRERAGARRFISGQRPGHPEHPLLERSRCHGHLFVTEEASEST